MAARELKRKLEGAEPRAKAAQIRTLLPLIERKLAEGLQLPELLGVLEAGGVKVSIATLRSYLYRFRKQQRAARAAPAGTVPAPEPTRAPTSASDAPALPMATDASGNQARAVVPEQGRAVIGPHLGVRKGVPPAPPTPESKTPAAGDLLQDLDRIMRPDADERAATLAQYEQLVKPNRRGRA